MLNTEEKSQLTKQADELTNEVRKLRTRLHELNDQKEKFFDQRNHVSREISELIKNVKGIRTERDTMTTEVKLSKEEREKLNDDIKKAIADAKVLQTKRDELQSKSGLKEDPRFMMRELERMNYKIETEAMSFEKEKKLMKVINAMKKKVSSAKEVMVVSDKLRTLSREIDRMKAVANQAHEKVQVSAKASQEKHSGMVEVSHKIDELKKKEEEFNVQITAKKAEMQPIGAELDAKAKLLNEVRGKLGLATEEGKQQKAAETKKKLTDRADEVRAKLMRGEKLTTEDILVLQGADK